MTLKLLRIQNLILIESAEIPFESGFNVLSGETGSGKSAIMNALSLISGDRADIQLIRYGFDKGSIEAIFDIDALPEVQEFLEVSGIEHGNGEELIVRREINVSGKSRSFVNNQIVQLSLLKQISSMLIEVVGQHANKKLLSLEEHRQILDTFGNLSEDVKKYQESWKALNSVQQELSDLIDGGPKRLRDIERLRIEIEEISSANLVEGEEQTLFSEYSILVNADELVRIVSEISNSLSGERSPILSQLSRQKSNFEHLIRLDPSLKEASNLFHSALLELQEVDHLLNRYRDNIEYNPNRAEKINARLTLIDKLKKHYGLNIEEIQKTLKSAKNTLEILEKADYTIEQLQEKMIILKEENDSLSKKLTQKRTAAAELLTRSMSEQLQLLNMPKAKFYCHITPQSRNSYGDDRIEFFLKPNAGEREIPIKECASGGELSRIVLSLQELLAGKANIPTIIFDEVDANIGGETAAIVGQKMKSIGTRHQVLCITHFPQVAKFANHHLQIVKIEDRGRTFSEISVLDKKARSKELQRMHG